MSDEEKRPHDAEEPKTAKSAPTARQKERSSAHHDALDFRKDSDDQAEGIAAALKRKMAGAGPAPTFFLAVLTVIAVGAVLKEIGHLLVPLLVAFFLSFLLWPMVARLRSWRVPGGLAIAAAGLSVVAALGLVGYLLTTSVASLAEEKTRNKYEQNLVVLGKRITKSVPMAKELEKKKNVEKLVDEASKAALSIVGGVVGFVSNVALILVYLLFILGGRLGSEDRVARAFSENSETIKAALENVDEQVNRYLGAKTMINLGCGVLFWLTCLLMGIDFPVLWGFIAFVITFIPAIGSIVAPVAPVLFAFVQYPDAMWRPLTLAAILVTLAIVIFNAVEPKVMGDKLGLSPLVVMFALVFFGWMWGIWGAVLSVPLAAVIKIISENFEATKPIAVLME